jgi:hypothetical protein
MIGLTDIVETGKTGIVAGADHDKPLSVERNTT